MKTNTGKSKSALSGEVIPLRRGASRKRNVPAGRKQPPRSRLEIKSILVPIDFSAPSKKALSYAASFAEQFGAKLILLHVVEPVAVPGFIQSSPLMLENEKLMASCKAELQQVIRQQALDPHQIERTLVRQGRGFREIADAARTLKADLIIMSTHGYTAVEHVLLGSTTERVVRCAPCPVLVVREREHDFLGT